MDNIIITISRGYGSNGVAIGKLAAKLLGINYYDDASLKELASPWLRRAMDDLENLPPEDAAVADEDVFRMQIGQIRELADKQHCVFVGRCADYILRNYPHVLNVFITADLADRKRRILERMDDLTEDKAEDMLEKTDKRRAGYYNYYTGKTWGAAASYHVCINSSVLGIDGTVDYLCGLFEKSGKGEMERQKKVER